MLIELIKEIASIDDVLHILDEFHGQEVLMGDYVIHERILELYQEHGLYERGEESFVDVMEEVTGSDQFLTEIAGTTLPVGACQKLYDIALQETEESEGPMYLYACVILTKNVGKFIACAQQYFVDVEYHIRNLVRGVSVYVGCRDTDEVNAAFDEGTYTHAVYVDAPMRCEKEDAGSFLLNLCDLKHLPEFFNNNTLASIDDHLCDYYESFFEDLFSRPIEFKKEE